MHVDVKEEFGMEIADCVELWLVVKSSIATFGGEQCRACCVADLEDTNDGHLYKVAYLGV